MFAVHPMTLPEAVEAASGSDRVVLAVATASWCGPCQQYKRNGLADPAVAGWVAEHALPIMIDVERDRADASALAPHAVPMTYVLREGKVIASLEGPASGERLLAWLEAAVDAPATGRLIPTFAHDDRGGED
jgi:thioredoxin-like negative regulator of GroEL